MYRRDFLYEFTKVAGAGIGVGLLPGGAFAEILDYFMAATPFTIEGYGKSYQEKVKVMSYDKATNRELGLNNSSLDGHIEFSLGKSELDSIRSVGLRILTPRTVYYQEPTRTAISRKLAEGLIFTDRTDGSNAAKMAGLYKGPAKVVSQNGKLIGEGTQKYIVHPNFLQYLHHQDYFCYGTPSSRPVEYFCVNCRQSFVRQNFFYSGDNSYGAKESLFWHNAASCSKPSKVKGASKYHKTSDESFNQMYLGIDFEQILPCTCENKIPTERGIKSNRT